MRARTLCTLFLVVLSLGCESDDAGAAMVVDAANDAGASSLCEHVEPDGVGVASASFGAGALRLEPIAALAGAPAAAVVESKAQGLGGLVAHRDGLIALGWTGFWDIDRGGSKRWIELGTFVTGAVAGDVDGDGDQDAMILSYTVEVGRGLVTHLLVFERTADGLVQRTEARESAGVIGMPFVFHDLDADGDLDILTHEGGALVAYVDDGAFAFARQQLGEPLEGYTDSGAIAVADLSDRDDDGVEDLLFVIGRAGRESGITVVEQAYVVLPGDEEGGFKPAVVSGNQETTAAGLNIADVTGDGIADVITQQNDGTPRLHLVRSVDATSFAAPVDIGLGAGVQFADADGDGTRDIITTLEGDRLVALIARDDDAEGAFELHELDIELNATLLAFTGESASDGAPPRLHVLYQCPGATDGGSSP